jgi:histone H3/H4
MTADDNHWRICSTCKAPIAFGAKYWTCSVSTCNRKRTGLVFCSVDCWDAHVPVLRHREAWAEEQRAPLEREPDPAPGPGEAPRSSRRSVVREAGKTARADDSDVPREILIVASRLKAYIQARAGLKTSNDVMAALSDHVRSIADEAIDAAQRAGRQTVLERDVPRP